MMSRMSTDSGTGGRREEVVWAARWEARREDMGRFEATLAETGAAGVGRPLSGAALGWGVLRRGSLILGSWDELPAERGKAEVDAVGAFELARERRNESDASLSRGIV